MKKINIMSILKTMFFILNVSIILCYPECCNFTCMNQTPSSEVIINDMLFECVSPEVCNRWATNDCRPCVLLEGMCKHVFVCGVSPQRVFYNNMWLNCPDGKKCNTAPTDNCTPCIDDYDK